MNAVPSTPPSVPALLPMTTALLPRVVAIEQSAYAFPWTLGNFVDSLAAGYHGRVLVDDDGTLLGYWVAMHGVDEVHLLNITVAPLYQRQGHARRMLDALVEHCHALAAKQLWLEVRESNQRAREIYLRYGFRPVGVRRGYYPAARASREDAVVMSLDLTPGGGAA